MIYSRRKNSQHCDEDQERYELTADRNPGFGDIQKGAGRKKAAINLNISRHGYKCSWRERTSGKLTDIYLSPDISAACSVCNTKAWKAQTARRTLSVLPYGRQAKCRRTQERPLKGLNCIYFFTLSVTQDIKALFSTRLDNM